MAGSSQTIEAAKPKFSLFGTSIDERKDMVGPHSTCNARTCQGHGWGLLHPQDDVQSLIYYNVWS